MRVILNENGLLDLEMNANGIVQDLTLESAYMVSVLTDRRADPEDILPFMEDDGLLIPDRRGYVGDILDERNRLVGSKIWLLSREIATEQTRRRAQQYTQECVQWAIDDGYVSENIVTASYDRQNPQRLNILIEARVIDGIDFKLNFNNVLSTYSSEVLNVV